MPLEQFRKLTLEEMLVESRSWPEPPPDEDDLTLARMRFKQAKARQGGAT